MALKEKKKRNRQKPKKLKSKQIKRLGMGKNYQLLYYRDSVYSVKLINYLNRKKLNIKA